MAETRVLPDEIGEGPDLQPETLLANDYCRLMLIRLRNSTRLPDHAAPNSATIQVLHGSGAMTIEGEEHSLSPGTVIAMPAGSMHSVRSDPEMALLVSFFLPVQE